MRSQLSLAHRSSIISTALSAVTGIALMVFALWIWQHAIRLADGWIGYGDSSRPDVAKWAFRSGAIAIAAVSQGVFVIAVWGRLYQRQLLDSLVKMTLAVVFAIAVISAITLGLAAR